jgi:tetratricopeptide (TPR) repeat protein
MNMDQFQRDQDDAGDFDGTCGVEGTFTLTQLASLLNVQRRRVRAWVTAGLIEPISEISGVRYFDFCQVASAKTLSDLAHAGVGTERVHRSLEQVRNWWPDTGEPLDQNAIVEKHGRLLVRLESGLVEPSGQMYFDFGDDPSIIDARPATAEEWFQLGCQHEEDGALDDAIHAYREALLTGGPHADTCFNLANALYAVGRKEEASERYRQAVELQRDQAEVWNNLGVALGDLGQCGNAESAFHKAIQLGFTDAQFNLAILQERQGRNTEARQHWKVWLRDARRGARSEYARARLAE